MGLKVTGIGSTTKRLQRISRRTHKRQLEALREGANEIEQLAKDNAPIRTGALERSIKQSEDRDHAFNNRKSIYIGIDVSELGEGFSRYGHNYGEILHEDEEWDLGDESQKKAATGKKVGPKFLSRAVEEIEDELRKKIERIAVEEALNK